MLITDKQNIYSISADWWDWDGPEVEYKGYTLGLIDDMDTFREQFKEWARESDHDAHIQKVGAWPGYLTDIC